MTVRFEVTDINDNTPQFGRSNYTYQVNEGPPPINIGRVQVRFIQGLPRKVLVDTCVILEEQ